MSAISEKSRPKSLRRKRSVASSTDLPKLYRQFSKNGIDHQEAIEASMSSTNKLIMNAFRDMNIGTNKAETASTRNHANDFMTKGETSTDAHLSSFLLERSFDERCILTEESISGERPSTQSSETECPILHDENGSLDDSEDQTLLKTPLSAKELKLGRTKVINTSSSSIDSGVYSPRSSKRPSVELLSPVDPQSNHIIYPQRRNRTLSGGNGCRPANKASLSGNPVVSVDDTSTCKGSRRLSVDQDAFSELLKAATKLVLDAHPLSMSDSDKAGLQGNSLFLRNSLQYFKRRKSEWDIAGLKPQPEKVVRKKSAEPVLQRVSSKSREPKSKKVSACIICERNKRANESTTSSILIKTTMVRTMQERRRFSEVLKVSCSLILNHNNSNYDCNGSEPGLFTRLVNYYVITM